MTKKIFITGVGTDVGKTICSAIVCESLKADYWKPIQAGDIGCGDNEKVQSLVSNPDTKFHANSYALNTPASPHYAAHEDGIEIELDRIVEPETTNTLVIEGAGGLLVPLNTKETILDLIKKDYHVIVVSRHYLGSINHTLMTLDTLIHKGLSYSVIFNGNENKASEDIIQKLSPCSVIGRIDEEQTIDAKIIKKYSNQFHSGLSKL